MSVQTRDPYAPVAPEIERQAAEIVARPYRKAISGDREEGFLIQVPDLPGCMTVGETMEEAVSMLPEAMMAWLTVALDDGLSIPAPSPEPTHSGKLTVRMPPSLHRRLAEQADAEGVSINQWIVTLLAVGAGERRFSELAEHTGLAVEEIMGAAGNRDRQAALAMFLASCETIAESEGKPEFLRLAREAVEAVADDVSGG